MDEVATELYRESVAVMMDECRKALESVKPEETDAFLQALRDADQIFFVGVGRVLLMLEATAKRLAHLGFKTHIVGEITEPAITENDLLVVGSGSGESLIPVAIAQKAVKLGAKVAYIGSNMNSTVAGLSSVRVRIPVRTKLGLPDEIDSKQPMTSLFEQSLLLYGDALAMRIVAERDICLPELWKYHANLE